MVSEKLKKAVDEKDLIAIKAFFYSIILSDPMFKTGRFDEALEYVKKTNGLELLETYDGEKLESEDKWDDEYFDYLSSKLQDNFSIERIEQLKLVSRRIEKNKSDWKDKELRKNHDNKDIKLSDENTEKNKSNVNSERRNSTSDFEQDDYTWLFVVGIIAMVFIILKKVLKRR